MRHWLPVLIFLTAALAVGLPIGIGLAAGWFCDCHP